jgi:hypothetical protein
MIDKEALEKLIDNKLSEMVLKYRTENFCNFQSNETRNEYEEEIPKVRRGLQS